MKRRSDVLGAFALLAGFWTYTIYRSNRSNRSYPPTPNPPNATLTDAVEFCIFS